jgi:hypothetical protein
MGGYELDLSGLEHGQTAVSFEHVMEPSGSTKCGEFLDWLGN